jgi:hypothetical protein
MKLLSIAAEREAGNFSSEVFFRGRMYLASVSSVGGTRWWVYEILDPAEMPARHASFWAKRVVISGIILIIMFGLLSYKLAMFWLKD